MAKHDPQPRLFLGEADSDSDDLDWPQGQICVRSLRCPDKATSNEDSAAVIPVGPGGVVLAVADGVGGGPSGREASNLAVTTLRDVLSTTEPSPDNLRTTIIDAVEESNRRILNLGRGAATTLVVGEVSSGCVRSYHVGDSELLAVGQRGRIRARVTAHSPTGFAVEAGLLDENEAVEHDARHLLFNVIGATDMRIEIGAPVRLNYYDTVLLCSDGLLDNVYLDEIVASIRRGTLVTAADTVTRLARDRMSGSRSGPSKPDDLTIVLYRPPRRRRR
jgi:serine/threonine protein phosphatase PrpC